MSAAVGPAPGPEPLLPPAGRPARPVPRSDSRLRPTLHSLLPGPFPFRSRPGDLSFLILFFNEVTVVMLGVVVCSKSAISSQSALHLLPNPTMTLTFQRPVCPAGGFPAPPTPSEMPVGSAPGARRTAEAAPAPQPAALRAPAEVTSIQRWLPPVPWPAASRRLAAGRPRGLQFSASGFFSPLPFLSVPDHAHIPSTRCPRL